MSAYRVAIDQTTKTIDRRARYFRNLIVTVVVLSLGSIGWSLVTWTILPFSGFLLLVPSCGFFFVFDHKVLKDWRSHLVDSWVDKRIDFGSLCSAVSDISTLPKDTVQGMLATLPSARDLVVEQGVSSTTREAVAAAVAGIHGCQSDALVLKTTATAIVSVLVAIAATRQMWEPLLGVMAVVLLPILRKWLKRRRIATLKQRTVMARTKVDFSKEKYEHLVASLEWAPISKSERDGLLNQLGVPTEMFAHPRPPNQLQWRPRKP